jgi:hypothetical protein
MQNIGRFLCGGKMNPGARRHGEKKTEKKKRYNHRDTEDTEKMGKTELDSRRRSLLSLLFLCALCVSVV